MCDGTGILGEIEGLLDYGEASGLLAPPDRIYARNRLLAELGLQYWKVPTGPQRVSGPLYSPEPLLDNITDWARARGDTSARATSGRDALEARLMDCLMPRPSEVIRIFNEKLDESPCGVAATDYLYELSRASNYLRAQPGGRLSWMADTEYGPLEITINEVKPEKDPVDIARGETGSEETYPACLLCIENEGYRGGPRRPSRANHRLVPVSLAGETWYLQYSPYAYYPEHCIVIREEHVPMELSGKTFERLLDFVSRFPRYFLGSNADLPGVGGSILSHDHFQGGGYHFPVERAQVETRYELTGAGCARAAILDWPMPVIRVSGQRGDVQRVAQTIWARWLDYDNPAAGIYSHTDGQRHNTVTPIARRRGALFELDIILRNNRTSPEHPLGIFHPHEDLHHIKKENIGLIEAMGFAILPGRLAAELELLAARLAASHPGEWEECLEKHRVWYRELRERYGVLDTESARRVLQHEVGQKFRRVLEDAGVFKRTEEGRAAFGVFAREALAPFGPRHN